MNIQFKDIVKKDEPKPQAKAWDEDDQFDHVLPLHQILQRYRTDPINVILIAVKLFQILHCINIKNLLTIYFKGLTDEQAIINRGRYGLNVLIPPAKETQLRKFIRAVVGGLNALLLASAMLSFVIFAIQLATADGAENDDV